MVLAVGFWTYVVSGAIIGGAVGALVAVLLAKLGIVKVSDGKENGPDD